MSSTASWGAKPSKKIQQAPAAAAAAALDAFVGGDSKAKLTKRLNADIPIGLHARVKAGCALEGREMTDVLIELLEQRFPEGK